MQVIEFGSDFANVVLLQAVESHDLNALPKEIEYIKEKTTVDFKLIAFKVDDWNTDLSPWTAPAVYGHAFGQDAQKTLNAILTYTKDKSKTYILGGYSLAGLFSLWASYRTDAFSGIATASPSIWFPDFLSYMQENDIKTDAVYLSLGDKENKSKNKLLSTVAEKITDAKNILDKRGVVNYFEWNQGNHFTEPDIRTAKAFAWVINNLK